MVDKKKEEIMLSQEDRNKIYKEEINKKKKAVAKKMYDFLSEGGVTLYIFLSSIIFGIGIPMFVVATNPFTFEKAFGLAPMIVTGLLALISIIMFLGWFLFGALTVELLKNQKNKNKKKKRWWER